MPEIEDASSASLPRPLRQSPLLLLPPLPHHLIPTRVPPPLHPPRRDRRKLPSPSHSLPMSDAARIPKKRDRPAHPPPQVL